MADGAVLAFVWSALLVVMIAFGRLVATRRHWPLDLPRDPKAWLLAVHFFQDLETLAIPVGDIRRTHQGTKKPPAS